jgi:hypothetical protein
MKKAIAVASKVKKLDTAMGWSAAFNAQVNWVHAHHTNQNTRISHADMRPVKSSIQQMNQLRHRKTQIPGQKTIQQNSPVDPYLLKPIFCRMEVNS